MEGKALNAWANLNMAFNFLIFNRRLVFVMLAWCMLSLHVNAQALPEANSISALALPQLGDGADMSPATERRLGDRIARELYRDPDYLDDPIILDYVQSLWQPLLVAARERGDLPPELDRNFAWEILLGRDRSVNAFALPGAYFGLHLGLVGTVTSRDELASVLAHELSHVTQRHISRLISRQSQQTPWLVGAMILGAMAASRNPGAANAVIVGGQAVAAQTQLNFSRDMEREADRVGFGVLTQAGFAPQGFVTMFAKLQQASRLNDAGRFPYLRSHPLTTERMSDMQNRIPITVLSAMANSNGVQDIEQAMVAARARVLSNMSADGLRVWAAQAKDSRFQALPVAAKAGILYGTTLAALYMRDFATAQKILIQLSVVSDADANATRLVLLLKAEIALAQSDAVGAAELLNNVSSSGRRPEVLMAAQAMVKSGNPAAAAQNLQAWLADHPRDAAAWQELAHANTSLGRRLAAIRAEAEVNIAQLNYADALIRLQAAQDFARTGKASADYYEMSIVDTRIKQVQQVLKEQALER